MKKLLSILMCGVLMVSMAGCTGEKKNDSEKIQISVGEWPTESNAAYFEKMQNFKKQMEDKYPEVEIVPDQWVYDTNSFIPKASSGQLPTLYTTHQTETKKIMSAGYAKDITEALNAVNWIDRMNPKFNDLISTDGKYYGIIRDAYVQGLVANVKLFEEAGLLDENGVPMFPETYEELAETAQTIKEKTGKAGLVLPTTNNCGGWHFMNIAWSFGVNFMEQKDGKWISTFDSPEAVEALQYVKDLKWKYNALPDNTFIDIPEMQKQFATDQAAMYFAGTPNQEMIMNYGMPLDRYSVGLIPAGKAGRYAQTGGKVYMFSPEATDEQVEYGLKWLELIGASPEFDDEIAANLEKNYITDKEKGYIVGQTNNLVWTEDEERVAAIDTLREKYRTVDAKFTEQFEQFDKIEFRAEEPMNCQQLYAVLDAVIQEVLNNKDADPAELLKKANSDFQKNYLNEN